MREEAEADERRRREAVRGVPGLVERRFVRNSLALAFLPFGVGQFQNGQRAKGWLFLGSEAVLAGVSMAAFTTNFALYGFRPVIRCEEADPTTRGPGCSPGYRPSPDQGRSQLLLKVQLVSGALFFAAAIWGVTDAVLHFQPEVELIAPERAGGATASQAGRGPRFLFTSLDGGWGGALAFRF